MAAHLARGFAEAVSPIAYVVMVVVPGWLQLVLFSIGLTRHIFRKRNYGPYRDWRNSQTPLNFKAPSVRSGLSPEAFGNVRASWRDILK